MSPLAATQTWILDGQTLENVREALAQIYPHTNPEKTITEALQSFAAMAQQPADAVRGWCLAATRDLYRKLNSVGDYTGALRAVQLLDRLAAGNRAPKDLEI